MSASSDFIARWEGCKLKAYKDVVGVWTIGYGYAGRDVKPGMVWTQAQADEKLEHFVNAVESVVQSLVTVPLNDNQLISLTSFTYNLGSGALGRSTLLKKLNAGDYTGAAEEFLKWDRAGGKVVTGLTNRRQAERALFLKT